MGALSPTERCMEVHFPCQHIAHSSARSLEGTSLDAVTDRSVKWFHTRHGPLERWVLPFHSHRQTDLRNRGLRVLWTLAEYIGITAQSCIYAALGPSSNTITHQKSVLYCIRTFNQQTILAVKPYWLSLASTTNRNGIRLRLSCADIFISMHHHPYSNPGPPLPYLTISYICPPPISLI